MAMQILVAYHGTFCDAIELISKNISFQIKYEGEFGNIWIYITALCSLGN